LETVVDDGLAGSVAVRARTLRFLQLEELQQAHGLTGGGHHQQLAAGEGEHEPGRGHVEHLDAAVGEQRQ